VERTEVGADRIKEGELEDAEDTEEEDDEDEQEGCTVHISLAWLERGGEGNAERGARRMRTSGCDERGGARKEEDADADTQTTTCWCCCCVCVCLSFVIYKHVRGFAKKRGEKENESTNTPPHPQCTSSPLKKDQKTNEQHKSQEVQNG
jgi:hypothetical protein